MAEITDLDVVDANNTDRFPENQAPSSLNDGGRALEGMVARWYSDTDGTLLTTGAADAYLLAPNRTISAYADGDLFVLDFHATNTGASTINVSSLGVKSIVRPDGSALSAGDLTAGQKSIILYDGTNFQLISNPGSLGALAVLDSVDTAQIAAGAVDTTELADDAVTLPKIAAGTDGELITWDASGDPATVATGTAGQVLTSNGAGAAPTMQDAGNARVLLETQVVSGVSSVDFSSNIDNTYDRYELDFEGLTVATDDVELWMRVFSGPGWQADASDYAWGISRLATVGSGFAANSGDTKMSFFGVTGAARGLGNASNEHFNGRITFTMPDDTSFNASFYWNTHGIDASGFPMGSNGVGAYIGATAAITGVRILAETGNISGTFRLYGVP